MACLGTPDIEIYQYRVWSKLLVEEVDRWHLIHVPPRLQVNVVGVSLMGLNDKIYNGQI